MTTAVLTAGPEVADAFSLARAMIGRYSAATEDAIAAVPAGDLDAIDGALAARAKIAPVLEKLFQSLLHSVDSLGALGGADLVPLLRAAQTLDTRLQVALGAALQSVAKDLVLLADEETVRSAYGQSTPLEGRNINLVR